METQKRSLKDIFLAEADSAYWAYIRLMATCPGWEKNALMGTLEAREIQILMQAAEQRGKHKAFREALAFLASD